MYYTFSDAGLEDLASPGDDPQTQWVKVDKINPAIAIAQTSQVRLVTVKAGETSEAAWYYLGIQPAPVAADPGSGTYQEPQDVSLSTDTQGANIYYTTDGSDPRESGGILYDHPLTFYRDTTLRAVAEYNGVYSDVTSFYYVFDAVSDDAVEAFYPSGVYEGSVQVTLTAQNPEREIEYSTDGGQTYQPYTGPLTIDRDTELTARSVGPDGDVGAVYKFTYTIKPLPPVFAPESTQFTNADTVTVLCEESSADNTDRYELWYTTDGSDPQTSPTAQMAESASDMVDLTITGYTVVSAVVKRDGVTYSSVVTHSYDIVTSKPVKPLTTLVPGYYTHKIGGEGYTTQFMPVPAGTKIYYTIGYDNAVVADPVPGAEGTVEYQGEQIALKGETIIKAVAVNVFGAKSDIGVFGYTITPESPRTAPSSIVGGEQLPVIPVDAVEGSTVTYSIGGFKNTFVNTGSERFYIDLSTGNAYRDADCTELLGEESTLADLDSVSLEIWSELNGVSSQPNSYTYRLSDNPETLSIPYASRQSGTYEEIDADGENHFLLLQLYALNQDAEIAYMLNNDGVWLSYTPGTDIKLQADTVLHVRAERDGQVSGTASYVYEFVPLAPVIVLPSGRYAQTPVPSTTIVLDSRAPDNVRYTIFYRANGDLEDYHYQPGTERPIEHTMSLKAYVVNPETGKKSANTIHYYIIESASAASGSVFTGHPYEVYPGDTKYIGAHLLSESPYSEGIKLNTLQADAKIKYFYEYTRRSGGTAQTETFIYDNAMPIFANASMSDLTITAWLVDADGNQISDAPSIFHYVFVDLETPVTSLAETGETEFKRGTDYTFLSHYPDDPNVILYYTLDGSDPTDAANENRQAYDGQELTLEESVTVKAVYFKACGSCVACKDDRLADCVNAVYGPVGEYRYTVQRRQVSIGGGGFSSGGGGQTIDNTRRYTKDLFGNEHPTHIGYINGYPDGSVQADGQMTREEIAAVLYRVKNKTYDEPITVTGERFTDVAKDRWSVLEIEYLTTYDVIKGYPDGSYGPERNLTRAEFAALVRRFVDLEDAEIDNPFPDVEEELWAYADILAIYQAGLIDGYEDGTFRPQNEITRAEVMTIVNRILGRNPDESYVKTLDFNPYTDLDAEKWYYVTVLEATVTHDYYLADEEDLEIKWENFK